MHAGDIPWLSLLALGAAHGVNPAMGWLFAVGRGLQQRDRRAVWRALGPLALGHAVAIGVAVLLASALGWVVSATWLRWIVAGLLLAVGIDGLVHHRHVRLRGMRVSAGELATWSFLMASMHGAGLMVLPFVLGNSPVRSERALLAVHDHLHATMAVGEQTAPLLAGISGIEPTAVTASLIHTLGYLAVTGALAVVVYEKLGLRILRRAWINLNVVWACALIAAAVMTIAS
jgi:hypothetical protein